MQRSKSQSRETPRHASRVLQRRPDADVMGSWQFPGFSEHRSIRASARRISVHCSKTDAALGSGAFE